MSLFPDFKRGHGDAADAQHDERVRVELRARDIAYAYGRNQPVLERVRADITPGSFLAILGVNGCGKSTLLGCLDGMIEPARGEIELGGATLSSLSARRSCSAHRACRAAQPREQAHRFRRASAWTQALHQVRPE